MGFIQVGLFLILCMAEFGHAGHTINIALDRPAYQSNTLGSYSANRAVDGNRNTNLGMSCSCTRNNVMGPWWCVDLGAIFHVTRVMVVNRNAAGHRLNGINIGVMNELPTTPLQVSSYSLCATFPGPAYQSQIITLNCTGVRIYSSTVEV